MEPPFTRERLSNIKDEFEKQTREEEMKATVDILKLAILRLALGNHNCGRGVRYLEKNKAVITFEQIQYQRVPNPYTGQQFVNRPVDFPEILRRLQAMFPDSTFQIDPLNTYVIIDWS
jgi:hypothetical protein